MFVGDCEDYLGGDLAHEAGGLTQAGRDGGRAGGGEPGSVPHHHRHVSLHTNIITSHSI